MKWTVQRDWDAGSLSSDALVLAVHEGGDLSPLAAAVDSALGGAIAAMRERKEIKGSVGEATSLLTYGRLPVSRIVMVGLGKPGAVTAESIRRASAVATRAVRRAGLGHAAIEVPGAPAVDARDATRALVEGAELAAYRFDGYRSSPQQADTLIEITVLAPAHADVEAAMRIGEIMARGANYARDLANEPPNVLNPAELARRAEVLARESGMEFESFDPAEMARRGMGAILAVGQGSANQPRLIVLRYRAAGADSRPTLGLVGKGITFDTGGISLKPGADMHIMKTDMGGAAAVVGAMHAITELRPTLNVTAIVASAENMPDGTAFRPGDILRAMNGKTIEIQNTDAEGRLVLADALSYAVELGLAPIVDLATLTGACTVALGPFYSGLFSNADTARDALVSAAATAGERIWPMPLDPDFRPLLDSSCADLRNVGGREGGAITAAMFLAEFVADQPWAHLDIAPTAFADNESAYYARGLATGHPVRTLAQLALDLAATD